MGLYNLYSSCNFFCSSSKRDASYSTFMLLFSLRLAILAAIFASALRNFSWLTWDWTRRPEACSKSTEPLPRLAVADNPLWFPMVNECSSLESFAGAAAFWFACNRLDKCSHNSSILASSPPASIRMGFTKSAMASSSSSKSFSRR